VSQRLQSRVIIRSKINLQINDAQKELNKDNSKLKKKKKINHSLQSKSTSRTNIRRVKFI